MTEQQLMDFHYSLNLIAGALDRIAVCMERAQYAAPPPASVVVEAPDLGNDFCVGDTVEVIALEERHNDSAYFSLGAQGRVIQTGHAHAVQVDFAGSPEWVKTDGADMRWYVSRDQIKIIKKAA